MVNVEYDCEDNDDQKPAPPHPSESSLKQENLISKSNRGKFSRISLIFNSMHWSELRFSLKKHIMVMIIVMIIVMVMVMVSLKRRSG